jgi:GT2 family glycosyltransferase
MIGDTGSTDPRVLELYGDTSHRVEFLGHYNFSRGNNLLARLARAPVICLLNNDVELISCDFSHALSLATDPGVGSVGAYLCYPDFRIQHAGMRICPSPPYRGVPEHFDRFAPLDGYPGLKADRDVVCVTGAMLVVRKGLYEELGGLDEAFLHEAQDADLELKLFKRGLRNVVTPSLVAFHLESATRRQAEWPDDRARLTDLHGSFIDENIYRWQVERGIG